jgi:hypothetical protein
LYIEGRVQHHRHPGGVPEGLDEPVVARVGALVDGLEPPRAIDMSDGRDHALLVRVDVDDVQHETRRLCLLDQPVLDSGHELWACHSPASAPIGRGQAPPLWE